MVALFYTKNGEDSLFFCDFFKSVDKLSEIVGRNAETQVKFPLKLRKSCDILNHSTINMRGIDYHEKN